MQDLIDWLRGVLDDIEAAAKAATPGPWRHNPDRHWRRPGTVEFEESVFAGPVGRIAVSVAGTGPSDDPQSMADATHIALHDPAAVLADVAAKRAILDACTARADLASRGGLVNRDPLAFAVRTLASAYRHRPGWKQEWEDRGFPPKA